MLRADCANRGATDDECEISICHKGILKTKALVPHQNAFIIHDAIESLNETNIRISQQGGVAS
jgi:hypothetical protein